MTEQSKQGERNPARRSNMATGAMLGCAVLILALPSAVLAFSSRFNTLPHEAASHLNSFTTTAADARLATAVPVRSLAQGHQFRFTPAGTPTRPDRSVTVAVRVDPQTARAITVRGTRLAEAPVSGATPLRIAPTVFTLGVSRGYQSFAQGLVTPSDIRRIEMPDIATFRAGGTGAPGAPSRFSPRITLDDREAAGRAPRTFAGDKDPLVDVGGAYRVTRNLDVTAGVRYSQDRERLQSLTDGKQDNQAVYVGTQFRF
ncbi:MAG TPA: hypothetical protein VF440_13825 [Novosphingobium sp.]